MSGYAALTRPTLYHIRYVDDFALFSNSKRELCSWKLAIIDRLATLRLTIHEACAQVVPVRYGIPWLGFVVYPTHRRLKARKARNATRHLGERYEAYRARKISFAEFDASIQGWVNHVRYADTWGLRKHVFGRLAKRSRLKQVGCVSRTKKFTCVEHTD